MGAEVIALRFATEEDASKLLEIYRPYVENTSISFETEVPTISEFQQRIREYAAFYPYLVAEQNGKVLGYAYAHAFHERKAYGWTVETSIYVSEDARGTGVGTRLYGALLPLLKAQGVHNVCAVVTIPNPASLAFHQVFGFQIGNLLPNFGYKNGTWHGVAYLHLALRCHMPEPEQIVSVRELPQETVKNLLNS